MVRKMATISKDQQLYSFTRDKTVMLNDLMTWQMSRKLIHGQLDYTSLKYTVIYSGAIEYYDGYFLVRRRPVEQAILDFQV